MVTSTSDAGTGPLLLVGFGVFGLALFLAGGVATLLTRGRGRPARAEKVRS